MTFLSPAWLVVAALAVPIILLHARLRRRVEVASVHIWRLIGLAADRRRSLQRPPVGLLLVLQLIALFALAVALAQPRFGAAAGEGEHVVFLVDASGSMQATDIAPSRFDAARDAVADAVRTLGPGAARISVVEVGSNARVAVARQADAGGILPLLDALAPTDGPADWAGASALVESLLRAGETTRLVVVGDDPASATLGDGDVEVIALGAADTGNRALSATLSAEADGDLVVAGTVRFFGTETAATEIAVRFGPGGDESLLDFGTIAVAPPEIGEGEALPEALRFEAGLELPGEGTLVLEIGPDAGPHDNASYFHVGALDRVARILVVGGPSEALLRALAAVDGVEVFQVDALPANADGYDLVVVDDVAIARKPATNVLWVERGRLADETEPQPILDAYFTGWDATHPLSSGVDWNAVTTPRAFAVPSLPGATVVVESSGNPLVQARTTPAGREVRLALAADASGWLNDPSYPLFIAAVIDWLDIATGPADPAPCIVGVWCVLPASLVAASIVAPDGEVLPSTAPADAAWLAAGTDAGFLPARAGFYRVAGAAGEVIVAVNRADDADGNLAIAASAGEAPAFAAGSSRPWWLLAIVLVVLAAETWFAGRGSERFLRPGALRRGVPFATQRRWHLGLRIAAGVALVLAIVPLVVPTREPASATVVVAAEAVTDGRQDLARSMLLATIDENRDGSAGRIGLVAAAAPPAVAVDLGESGAASGAPMLAPGADIGDAVALAVAMLPADRPGRVVVAGDGNMTAGNLGAGISAAVARSVPLDTVPLVDAPVGEVLVASVDAPATAYVGDRFTVNAFVHSEGPAEATIELMRNGAVVSTQLVPLALGTNRIEAVFDVAEAGDALFEVAVDAPSDVIAANNRDGVVVRAEAPPRILIVTPEVDWGDFFAGALAVQGLTAEVVLPDDAPFFISGFLEYDLVVLMNVPAIDLSVGQQRLIADYVETHGGGLLILGGERSFGPGGYFQTDLERVSPLSARVPQDEPGAALMFVLDRSGSMQARVEDVNRLDIAKEATVQAIGLLHPDSQVGVIVFDSEPHVIVPMQQGVNLPAIEAALAPVQPGGGTDLYPGLAEAVAQLSQTDALAKHIVVMTDGLLEPADFPTLLGEAVEAGITVSAVAIGGTADVIRAEAIARLGGGAFHSTQDFRALPSILSQEAMMMSGSPVEVIETPVFWIDRGADFLAGLPEQLPPLENYVRTTERETATLHLAALDEEGETVPIMASWRYGNGRVLAFASHGAGSGTQNWLTLPDYPLLWAQIARHFLRGTEGPGLHAEMTRLGDGAVLRVDALDKDGAPLADAVITATLSADAVPVALMETEAGRYEAALGALPPGTHSVTVTMGETTTRAALHVGYPARLNFARADAAALSPLAFATGGVAGPSDPLAGAAETRWALVPNDHPWIVLALILFIADLVVRYAPGLMSLRRRAARDAAPRPAPA
ncbi:MAG: VWA domain-containing protein [Bauldia sp.]|nr:VWA domain-containing protein [Bauldia sp.]